jgi:pimeloyl-ACP methyl ester carboxylesterase
MQHNLHLHRFDYYGTGENSGKFENVTLQSLRTDIQKEIGNSSVSIIGTRFGASLALDYFCLRPSNVINIVLIEPIIDGCKYIDYLRRKQHLKNLMTNTPDIDNEDNGFRNFEGYKTNAELIIQLKNFSLINIASQTIAKIPLSLIQVSNNAKPDHHMSLLIETLKKSGTNPIFESFKLNCFWERIPDYDYSDLTNTILNLCSNQPWLFQKQK